MKDTEPKSAGMLSHIFRLCVFPHGCHCDIASGSKMKIFIFSALINDSCLHLGQNNGKFLSSVSSRIFVLVLFSHMGQRTHLSIMSTPPFLVFNVTKITLYDGDSGDANGNYFFLNRLIHDSSEKNLRAAIVSAITQRCNEHQCSKQH